MNNDLEIYDPLDDYSFEELRAIGAEARRNGESYLAKLYYEGEIEQLQSKRAKLLAAIKAKPSDPKIPQAVSAIADIDGELQALNIVRLRAWPTDRRYPN